MTADPAAVERLIQRTRVERGLPRTIVDPDVLRRVAVLLRAGDAR